MAKKNSMSLEPQIMNRRTWYYEERKGICVVRQIEGPDGDVIKAETFYLPWAKVEASVKRWRRFRPSTRKERGNG